MLLSKEKALVGVGRYTGLNVIGGAVGGWVGGTLRTLARTRPSNGGQTLKADHSSPLLGQRAGTKHHCELKDVPQWPVFLPAECTVAAAEAQRRVRWRGSSAASRRSRALWLLAQVQFGGGGGGDTQTASAFSLAVATRVEHGQ